MLVSKDSAAAEKEALALLTMGTMDPAAQALWSPAVLQKEVSEITWFLLT